jgi:hypothetical protein
MCTCVTSGMKGRHDHQGETERMPQANPAHWQHETPHGALVARVGARIVVIVATLVVAAVVSDVIGRDLLATSRASKDLIQIVPHAELVGVGTAQQR